MKLKMKTSRQLSLAVGLLSMSAFIIGILGETWGFEAVAKQIAQTCLAFSSAISIYFLGSTGEKESQERRKKNAKK